MKYLVEISENKEYVQIHIDHELPKICWLNDNKGAALQLKNALEEIPGIAQVTSHDKYYLSIKKGRVFTVDQIVEPVLDVLCKFFQDWVLEEIKVSNET